MVSWSDGHPCQMNAATQGFNECRGILIYIEQHRSPSNEHANIPNRLITGTAALIFQIEKPASCLPVAQQIRLFSL